MNRAEIFNRTKVICGMPFLISQFVARYSAVDSLPLLTGVTSHVGYTLAQWNDGKTDEPLWRATFTSENKPLSVNCEVRRIAIMMLCQAKL